EQEDLLKARLPVARAERNELMKKREACRTELAKLLPTGEQQRAKRLLELETACTAAETKLQVLRRRLQRLNDLEAQVEPIRTTVEPLRFGQMKRTFAATGLSDNDWLAFAMEFNGDVHSVIERARQGTELAISVATDGDPRVPLDLTVASLDRWPLRA